MGPSSFLRIGIRSIKPDGEATEFHYDARGNVVRTVQRTATGQAHLLSEALYDHHNRKIVEIDANRASARWNYDDFGCLASRIDLGGVSYTYL